MNFPDPDIEINVDTTNPGQFFACCGLLELADRLCGNASGWFEGNRFLLACPTNLENLIQRVVAAEIEILDKSDDKSSPLLVDEPFDLRIDWWKIAELGSGGLKVWAGTMAGPRIALAMQKAIVVPESAPEELLEQATVVYDPANPTKKVEPFYFDARRGPNAHPRDVGFSPNDLSLKTTAFPVTEFLCLIGLQRARPAPIKGKVRRYRYFTWGLPTPVALLPAVITGRIYPKQCYEFESWFRTGQKKHKAFLTATPIN